MQLACLLGSCPTFYHFSCFPQIDCAFRVLIPGWLDLCMFQEFTGLSNGLFCDSGSFSSCCNSHRLLQPEVLKLYFSVLEPWVGHFVSLPSCSSWLICMRKWDIPVHQLTPCPPLSISHALPCVLSTLASCLQPLLPVWMKVSLIPWLLDLFLNWLLPFFCLCEEVMCIYLPLLLGWNL